MKKTKIYRYLGRNGYITSEILLEKIEPISMVRLHASQGKVLTNGDVYLKVKDIFLDELEEWYEVDDPHGQK
jgi:hypothetical protein